ncbi:N-acetyl-gamma-glutamyl-phosphate reductase [Alkalicoccus chagannorensis]|uniref:N-acetyl-gamma-glutamyl-phosphate reductase n=1 Tax=Alkalicoccus chagannorensis TaxID=427072 RepID=UPI000415FFD8|nr:N-acetyl-gamma-glutamyl-phosphate reductase [Alkalicoccus chagannorensis]
MKQAAIVGGTGYGALELIRLMENHPYVQVSVVMSQSEEGELLASRYPHLAVQRTDAFAGLDHAELDKVDIVFFATPAGVAKEMLEAGFASGKQVIDLSGDLRIDDPDTYKQWYKLDPPKQDLQQRAVYGLPELNRGITASAELISNPGCFATAALLALLPFTESGSVDAGHIIIDAKTGVSGAGRKQSPLTHFSETNDNFQAYKVGAHQHTPEIEQYASASMNEELKVQFQTHLLPMTRGIQCAVYAPFTSNDDPQKLLENRYGSHPFVRVRPSGSFPGTKEVYGSNYCDIAVHLDERTDRIMIISVIDNLMKGASGQAVQNMNIMNGWEEDAGLQLLPVYP